jgi:hypothetical protein
MAKEGRIPPHWVGTVKSHHDQYGTEWGDNGEPGPHHMYTVNWRTPQGSMHEDYVHQNDLVPHQQPQQKSEDELVDGLEALCKAEPGGLTPPPPAIKQSTIPGMAAKPALHNTVAGFMGGLKTLPKGSPERGKFITQHMNHAPFLSALKAHPQGAVMHQQLTAYLNSPTNAGFKPGAAVATAKNFE